MKSAQLVYQHLLDLPESIAAEVSARLPRMQGSAQGQVWIAPDFDAPLHDSVTINELVIPILVR